MNKTLLGFGLATLIAPAALPLVAHGQAAPAAPAPTVVAPAPAAPVPAPAAQPAPAASPAPVSEPAPMAMGVDERMPVVEPAAEPMSPADVEVAPTSVGGYISTGYNINFSDPGSKAPIPLNPYNRSGHTFMLHSAHLNVDHKISDAFSAHIGVDAGSDAAVNAAAPLGGGLFDVQEAYGAYANDIWTVTAGKFVTYEGIEVVGALYNPTVTHGLLYYYAEPVTHTGLKIAAQASDTVSVGFGIVNGWDNIVDNNGMKTFIGRLGITPSDKVWMALSAAFGSEKPNNKDHRLSVDFTGAATLSDAFALNFQGNFGMEPKSSVDKPGKAASWFGLGVQPVYTSGDFSFGSRLEWFNDASGFRIAGIKSNYFDVTVTPGYKVTDGFKLRMDLGLDIATEKVLSKGKKTQVMTEVAAEYTF